MRLISFGRFKRTCVYFDVVFKICRNSRNKTFEWEKILPEESKCRCTEANCPVMQKCKDMKHIAGNTYVGKAK